MGKKNRGGESSTSAGRKLCGDNSSSSSSSSKKETLDPTSLPRYEFVIEDYQDVGQMVVEYMKLFDWLIGKCSADGETLWDLPLSNPDVLPAYCLLTIDVPIFEIKKTDIIIHRPSVYINSMTINESWMVTSDCPFHVVGATKLPFSSSYMDLAGELTTLGIGRLAQALKDWNDPDVVEEKHGEAFRNVVYNISEICRFKVLKNAILKKLNESHTIYVSVEVEHKYKTLFTNWHLITDTLDKFRVLVEEYQGNMSMEEAKVALWDYPILKQKTGFTSFKETIDGVGLLMYRKA